jgi:hypothetical protein
MIQEIDVALPFPAHLPEGIALVDCQGSDSLNPLDFAAVDAALHRADQIFYVVSSRLGLRLADRDLLLHLQKAGLADKAALVYNVEAFEPLTAAELAAMQAKVASDLAQLRLPGLPVHTVNALLALQRAVRPEEAENIRRMWSLRGQASVLDGIEAGFGELAKRLVQLESTGAGAPARVLPLLVDKAQTTAKALLARDRQMFGLQSTELGEREVRTAVRRILEGERGELAKKLQQRAFEAFEKSSPLQGEIDKFLREGPQRLHAAQPLPEALKTATKHGSVMATALEVFNTDWTMFDNHLRLTYVNPFIERGLAVIMDSVGHLYRLIPGVLGSKLAEASAHALPPHDQLVGGLREKLDRLALATAVPQVLRPIVLLPIVANGLAGEFYARKVFTMLKAKLTRKEAPAEADLAKIQKLWERTLQQALKAAREDTEFSVSSARENFRFQYFGKIVEALFDRFEEAVMVSVERYFADLRRLSAASKLLLSGEERQRVEAYLSYL